MSKPKIMEIVESGNNGNGEYVKLVDGTMIEYGNNSGVDNGYRQIEFPIAFIDFPKVYCNVTVFDSNYVYLAQAYDFLATGCKVSVRYCNASGSAWGRGSNYFNWIAIGKWK